MHGDRDLRPARPGLEHDLRGDLAEHPLERGLLEVLRPGAASRRLVVDEALVRAHGLALARPEDLGPAPARHVLDAPHPGPPAREVVGVGDHLPYRLGSGGDEAAAAGRGH